MKTTLFLLLTILYGISLPNNVLCQTFSSVIQTDVTPSGETRNGYDQATLTLSKTNGTFTIKFNNLSNSQTFSITLYQSQDTGKNIKTMYNIDNDPSFQALLITEYKTTQVSGKYSYKYSICILGVGEDGSSTSRSTTFYANKK